MHAFNRFRLRHLGLAGVLVAIVMLIGPVPFAAADKAMAESTPIEPGTQQTTASVTARLPSLDGSRSG